MDRTSVDWHGVMPAIVTPFDASGAIDEAAYCRNIEHCIDYGCTGVVPTGCTGEAWSLTIDERKLLFKLAVETAKGRIRVIAGTGAVAVPDVIAMNAYAKEVGCDGVMIMPPFFPKLHSPEDILWHYRMVSDALEIPIILYNVPGYNVNELTPDLIARLADIDNVVAIKESTTDFGKFYKTMQLAGDRILVFTGQLSLYGVAAIEHGAVGAVSGAPNVLGRDSVVYFEACRDGDLELGLRLERKAVELWDLYLANGRNLYPSVKAGMNMLGLPGGYPRMPLRPLGEPDLTELSEGMERLGFDVRRADAAE